MKRVCRLLVSLGASLVFLACADADLPAAEAPARVVIGTGVPGAVYHPVGSAICRMFNLGVAVGDTTCVAISSRGSVANIEALRRGRIAFAIAQPDAADAAFLGRDSFASAGPFAALRAVLALHVEAFTVIARADSAIARFDDLKGRRVSVGNIGSGHYLTKDKLIAAYGWTKADLAHAVELGPAEQSRALCEGRVDAAFLFVGHPNTLMLGLATTCAVRLVPVTGPPVDRLIAAAPYYEKVTIPGGLYRGSPQATATFGARTVLLTTAAMPDETVCRLVRAVADYFDVFRRLHAVLYNLRPADLVPRHVAAPLHPAAQRCFKEHGLL